jgi:hypothetical protein
MDKSSGHFIHRENFHDEDCTVHWTASRIYDVKRRRAEFKIALFADVKKLILW